MTPNTLNIANINTMIDTFIRLDKAPLPEHPDRGFNMLTTDFEKHNYNQHNCGTAACIVGWSECLFKGALPEEAFGDYDDSDCCLVMPEFEHGYSYELNPEKFTLRAAIRVLQILRDTGKADWNEAIANPWEPETETAEKTDWLKVMMKPDAGVLLLEGPVRESVLETDGVLRAREAGMGQS